MTGDMSGASVLDSEGLTSGWTLIKHRLKIDSIIDNRNFDLQFEHEV
jgi:3-methyladenine DNA glycosylase Tag